MKRLTRRDEGSGAVYCLTDTYSAREKLCAYEDTGLEPDEIEGLVPRPTCCRECHHWRTGLAKEYSEVGYCRLTGAAQTADFFCKDGTP